MLNLKNASLSLTVDPNHGSNMVSFKVNGRELIYCDKKLLNQNDFTGNFVLWPFPNRVRDRQYVFAGRKHSLKSVKVPRGNYPLIHGLVRDEAWEYEVTPEKIKTWITITPKFRYWDCWPWRSRLSLTYTLTTKGAKVEYQVENLDKTELGFGFALHPLFRGARAIRVPAKSVMAADQELLPSGKLLPADLNELRPVSELNLDHVFTGLKPWPEVVFAGGEKLTIKTSVDFTHCVVYTGEKDKFSCVESQTCSTDAHNLDYLGFKKEAHLISLKPGQTHRGWIEYEVTKIKN